MISTAYAQAAGAQQGSLLGSFLPLIAIFAIFYFLLIRPQQKKQKELTNLINNLQKGDEVLTAGGIMGRITALDEHYAEIEIAKNVEIKMQRTSIINVLPKGSVKAIQS